MGNGLRPFLLVQRQLCSHRCATSTQVLGWAPATLTAPKHLNVGLLHSLALHLKKQHTQATRHTLGDATIKEGDAERPRACGDIAPGVPCSGR